MASQPYPPQRTPEIAGLMIRAYENPLVSLNKGRLFKPGYFWGGVRYLDVSVKLGSMVRINGFITPRNNPFVSRWNNLGGGFKYFVFSPLLGETIQFD